MNQRRIVAFDVCEETVTAARNGLHEARAFGRVSKRFTDFVNCFIEAVVEIHESVRRPEFFLQFLAGYYLARPLKQYRQNLKRLFLKANATALLVQFAGTSIQLESSKPEPTARLIVFLHGSYLQAGGSLPPA